MEKAFLQQCHDDDDGEFREIPPSEILEFAAAMSYDIRKSNPEAKSKMSRV